MQPLYDYSFTSYTNLKIVFSTSLSDKHANSSWFKSLAMTYNVTKFWKITLMGAFCTLNI